MLWIIYSLISAFLFGLKNILTKKFEKEHNVDSQIFPLLELLVGFVFIFLFFFKEVNFSKILEFDYFLILMIFLTGFFFFLFSYYYYKLLKETPISTFAPLMNLSPFFLIILSYFFIGEKISTTQFLGILILIISTYFLEHIGTIKHKKNIVKTHFKTLKKSNSKFYFSVFIMLFSISIGGMISKWLFSNSNLNSNEFFIFVSFFQFSFFIIYFLYNKELKKIFIQIFQNKFTLIIGGVSFASYYFIILALSVPLALVSLIVPLRRTSTIFSSLVGGILFHETNLLKKLIITLFMIFGIILIVI
jgi:drug/metabolite transporter (DMT)-like permease